MEQELRPGAVVKFHGGYNASGERCPICNFPCGYIDRGVIIERFQVWHIPSDRAFIDPNTWVAQLDNGAYVYGYDDQFELG